ncbi:MAG: Rid family detoxifying hydrolase [Candidatus Saccharibacteria bacterium]
MKQSISTDQAPNPTHLLSQAIISGDTIYVAGQVYNTADGTIINGSTTEKLAQIMKNITAILEAAGAKIDNIVKVVIYVTDMAQMPELNAAYPGYFTAPYPVREAICVKELPLGATIEISVTAVK